MRGFPVKSAIKGRNNRAEVCTVTRRLAGFAALGIDLGNMKGQEVKIAMCAVLCPALSLLGFAAIVVVFKIASIHFGMIVAIDVTTNTLLPLSI